MLKKRLCTADSKNVSLSLDNLFKTLMNKVKVESIKLFRIFIILCTV